MLLQTNSYIVPKDRRAEHQRLVRKFRQVLARLGCDQFEVYEQVGANWSSAEATGRYVQIMRFRDRKHQLSVQAGERTDPMAQRVIAEFCDLINFPYQQQQGLFAVGFYNGVLSPSPSRAAGEAAAAEAAVPRSERRARGAGAAAGFAMGDLGIASGLGASAAASAPAEADEAAVAEESFGAEVDAAGEDGAAGEDLAAEEALAGAEEVAAEEEAHAEESPAEELPAEELEPAAELQQDEQPEEAPAEVEAASGYDVVEEAAPEEAPAEEPAAEAQAEHEQPIPLAEIEADAAAVEQAPQPAEAEGDGLLDLEFELPDERATADVTEELSTDFMAEAPEQPKQDEPQPHTTPAAAEVGSASAQEEGGVEVIYEELPEPAEAPAQDALAEEVPAEATLAEEAPAEEAQPREAAAEAPEAPSREPAAAPESQAAAEDESWLAEVESLTDDPHAEAGAAPPPDLTFDDALLGEDQAAGAEGPEEQPHVEPAGAGAERIGQPGFVFAAEQAIGSARQEETEDADMAVTPFDNGWDEETEATNAGAVSEVGPAVEPVSEAAPAEAPPPAPPVGEYEDSADETPHPAHEYGTPEDDALLSEPMQEMREEPAAPAREEAQHAGRGQQRRATDPEDLDVLLAELDRALPAQRQKNGDYFADEELERALDEALREVHAQGAGGHASGERLGR